VMEDEVIVLLLIFSAHVPGRGGGGWFFLCG
jgi:hypothetical protein